MSSDRSALVAAVPRGASVHSLLASVRRRLAIRFTRETLRSLSDDILKDVGVVRCEIDHLAADLADCGMRAP